jgi:hypothetical protein
MPLAEGDVMAWWCRSERGWLEQAPLVVRDLHRQHVGTSASVVLALRSAWASGRQGDGAEAACTDRHPSVIWAGHVLSFFAAVMKALADPETASVTVAFVNLQARRGEESHLSLGQRQSTTGSVSAALWTFSEFLRSTDQFSPCRPVPACQWATLVCRRRRRQGR